MKISLRILPFLLFMLFIIQVSDSVEEEDEEEDSGELSRTFRLQGSDRPCSYRRRQGFCKRRSDCKRPTRHTCRIGLDPIVCCLDERKVTTTIRTTLPPKTRRPSQPKPKPDSIRGIDLTFPGCGTRSPKDPDADKVANNADTGGRRRGGLLSRRLGKRSISNPAYIPLSRRRRNIQHVIVGGVAAVENSWPWMVSIFKEPFPGGMKRFLCGASLISRQYVLTAAHCFDGEKGNIDPSKFSVVVGSHTTKDGVEYAVENILVHPEYQSRQYYNDITLIRIKEEVKLGKKVYPVCVPSDGLRAKIRTDINNVTVTGWGDTSFGGVSSKVLHEVSIPIVPLKECNNSYSKVALTSFPKGITNLFICAGEREGGKDACQGDSGGPMVTTLKDNAWVQLGVVSFGYGCAQPGFPGVYTRVSQYTKWLYDNTDLGQL